MMGPLLAIVNSPKSAASWTHRILVSIVALAIVDGRSRRMAAGSVYAVWAPRMLAILRIIAALLFLEHGTQKLLGFPPSENPGPALFSLFGLQGVIELVGGILLLLGLFTRPVAFILAGDMAVAYFMAHAPKSFFPMLNGGDAAILYCFVFLYLFVAGPGAWSADETLRLQRDRR
jgi:putative oxidoreductase